MSSGMHTIDCLFCKITKLQCHYHNKFDLYCRNVLNHICKKCKKNIRLNISLYSELKDYRCDHATIISRHLALEYHGLRINDNVCNVCMDEIRKEIVFRNRLKCLKRKEILRIKCTNESLFTKCAKIMVRDPGLLLIAATKYPLDENMWKSIHDVVPDTLRRDYAKELLESKKVNNRWMYNTISKVFSFYKKIPEIPDSEEIQN